MVASVVSFCPKPSVNIITKGVANPGLAPFSDEYSVTAYKKYKVKYTFRKDNNVDSGLI